jgi:putative DNA primase/helicase
MEGTGKLLARIVCFISIGATLCAPRVVSSWHVFSIAMDNPCCTNIVARFGILGGCYRPADDDAIRAAAWKFLESAFVDDSVGRLFKPTRSRVSDLIDALGSVCHLDSSIEPPAWLANEPTDPEAAELFPVANGLLHLPTGRLLSPTPRYFGLAASDVEFNPGAPDPKCWLGFLTDLFGEDVEAISTLQEYFGYTLGPDTSQQKIMLMVGPTRSGKGTIARAHMGLLGRDNVAAPTLASLQTNFGLAPLIGKPLAIISDARLSARSDQAIIVERLLSISGEDAITIDRKFLPTWTGRLPTRFMLLSNELPRLSDNSGALAKRFIVCSFSSVAFTAGRI